MENNGVFNQLDYHATNNPPVQNWKKNYQILKRNSKDIHTEMKQDNHKVTRNNIGVYTPTISQQITTEI